MSTEARLVEVCDAVVQRILNAWPVVGDDEVSRQYLTPVTVESLAGRKLWVFPADYGTVAPQTRGDDLNEYRVAVLIVERYTDAGQPPRAWLDERVKFAEQYVWRLLTNPRAGPLLGSCWPQGADVLAYDVAMLSEKKVFWSEVEITYQEEAEAL